MSFFLTRTMCGRGQLGQQLSRTIITSKNKSQMCMLTQISKFSSSSDSNNNNNSNNQSQDDSSSSKGDKKGETKKEVEKKPDKPKKMTPEKVARTKLNSLLQSLVKDTAARKDAAAAENKDSAVKIPRVDLAIPSKPLEKRRSALRAPKEPQLAADTGEEEIKLGKRVLSAVKKVAESMGGDVEQIESELVQKLKSQSTSKVKLSELVQGMQVDSTRGSPEATPSDSPSRSDQVRRDMQQRPPRRSAQYGTGYGRRGQEEGDRTDPKRRDQGRYPRRDQEEEDTRYPAVGKINIFGAKPLGVFTSAVTTKVETEQTLWDTLEAKELRLRVTHPPANGFEEMILWTEQKKLWTFPIDNELGMEEEAKYSFEDHVFLEGEIEPWCPSEGPIRTFMELVCVALAKNPYLTVPEKKDTIEWYYYYFLEKNAILESVGAAPVKNLDEVAQIAS